MDWRSNFGHPGIVRTCNEDLYWLASTREFWNCNGLDWWPFEDLPHPCSFDRVCESAASRLLAVAMGGGTSCNLLQITMHFRVMLLFSLNPA